MEKSYCQPAIKTNWTSPEEAFGACSASSSCAAFWLDCWYEYGMAQYFYCASIESIASNVVLEYCSRGKYSHTLFIKPGKSCLERQHFLKLKFLVHWVFNIPNSKFTIYISRQKTGG